jgi:hypothetical protein
VLPGWEETDYFSETDRAALRLTEAITRVASCWRVVCVLGGAEFVQSGLPPAACSGYDPGSSTLSGSPVLETKTTRSLAGSVRLVFSVRTWWAPGCSTQFSPWW